MTRSFDSGKLWIVWHLVLANHFRQSMNNVNLAQGKVAVAKRWQQIGVHTQNCLTLLDVSAGCCDVISMRAPASYCTKKRCRDDSEDMTFCSRVSLQHGSALPPSDYLKGISLVPPPNQGPPEAEGFTC